MSSYQTFAEYFAGIGLVGLGLGSTWELEFANDIDPAKYAMYAGYFGDNPRYVIGDIYDLDPAEIPTTMLATASFPCIDLSVAGNQNGLDGKHSGSFWGFVRILAEMGARRPRLVMLENVLGWLTAKGGRDFRQSIAALNQLGYTCDVFVLNAHHFTPQSRPRMFVIGVQDFPALPAAFLDGYFGARPAALHTARLLDSIYANRDLLWTAHSLPAPPALKTEFGDIAEALAPDDPWWWSSEQVTHIWGQMNADHRRRVVAMSSRDTVTYATAFKRVRAKKTQAEVRVDGLAGCLRTPSGGSSKQIVFVAGQGQIRVRWMTAREYARLQGVNDDFPLDLPYLQALRGFGDAVCVPAIAWISDHALNPLAQTLQPISVGV